MANPVTRPPLGLDEERPFPVLRRIAEHSIPGRGPVTSGDGTTSSVNRDLSIAIRASRNQPDNLAALAGFQRDHHRAAPSIYSGLL